jgi:hypothetical protein
LEKELARAYNRTQSNHRRLRSGGIETEVHACSIGWEEAWGGSLLWLLLMW